MSQLLTSLGGAAVAVVVTVALFVAANLLLDQAVRRYRLFTSVIGALAGAIIGALANSGGWFLGGPLWPVGGALVGGVVGGLVRGARRPPPEVTRRTADRWRPAVFLFPAFLFLGAGLVVPTIRTAYLSLRSRRSDEFVGLANYREIFSDRDMFSWNGLGDVFTSRLFLAAVVVAVVAIGLHALAARRGGYGIDLGAPLPVLSLSVAAALLVLAMVGSLRGVLWNNLYWVVIVTGASTAFGLAIAVLADRARGESVAKSLIFLPMAISFVGASVIWRFVYAWEPAGSTQIGLLNAVWVWFGGQPQAWTSQQPWNSLFLMVIMIWIQTGFAMVVLSAAIKGVPTELREAALVDGATEAQTFWRVTLPYIRGTVAVVVTTLVILVLKVYDIVKVMTNGRSGTDVIANRLFEEAFVARDIGMGSALAVLLFVAVAPVMYVNARRARKGEVR
jgi:ABC-type sugar transport system permease subunit